MEVWVEGEQKEEKLDIFARSGGRNGALLSENGTVEQLKLTYVQSIDDGYASVRLVGVVDNPKLNALSVLLVAT